MSEHRVKGLMRWVERPEVGSRPQTQHRGATPADAQAVAWLDWLLRHRERSAKTIEAYESTLSAWLDHCQEHGVDALRPCLTDLEDFTMRPTRHGGARSSATRRLEITALRGWFSHLHQRGLVSANPAAELIAPRAKRRQARPIPDAHWLGIYERCDNPKLRLAMGLGFYCGLRRQEIAELRGDQLTDDLIVSFVRKGGHEHTLPWLEMVEHHAAHPALRNLLPDPEAFVDSLRGHAASSGPRPMFWERGKTMASKMAALCARAGVPHFTPHQLRHSCATNLVNRGEVPVQIVQELLNHASLDTTRGYVDVGGGALRDWRRMALGSTRRPSVP